MLLPLLIPLSHLTMRSVVMYPPPVTWTIRGPYHTLPTTQGSWAHLPLDISLVLTLHICSAILYVLANLVQDGISLPEKSDIFQRLLFDFLLIHAKCLVNSLHIFAPAALLVDALRLCALFWFLFFWAFFIALQMPDTGSSLPVHGVFRMEDRPFPGLVQYWEISHVDGGSIPVAHELHLISRPSWLHLGTVIRCVSTHGA